MRVFWIWMFSVFFLSAACLFAQSGDEAAVRQVVQKYMDARDQNDPRAIEALFTADADQLVSSGEWRKGRAEVVKGTMASSQSSGGSTRNMWTSIMLARGADGWRIAAIRNMLPAAPAPSK